MKLTLNPFALVVKADDTFNFILSDHVNPVQLKPNGIQLQVLLLMS